MLQALGFKFYRKTSSPEAISPEANSPEANSPETNSPEANSPETNSHKASPLIAGYMCGGLLSEIGSIEAPSDGLFGRSCEIEVICDVTNPLLGENGATYVYGPQKGANPVMLKQLEAGMENLVRVAGGAANVADHLLPGAGAAGGVGYAVNHFLGGKIISGWRFFANLTNLKQKIAESDLVITGEGRIDSQSFNGKVIDVVTTLAKEAGKPVCLFCGINSCGQTADFITAADSIVATESTPKSGYPIFQLSSLEPDREKSMKNAAHLLERLAREAAASHLPIF
jgi:glycerate kinase